MNGKNNKRGISEATIVARAEKLKDGSPIARNIAKNEIGVCWSYRCGFITPTTLDGILGIKRRGHASLMVKQGLFEETKTGFPGNRFCMPSSIFTLTEAGVAEAERYVMEYLPYDFNASKIASSPKLYHDCLTHEITKNALISGSIQGYLSGRELATKFEPGIKQFDFAWDINGEINGIEVEITGKWGRKLDQFATEILEAIHTGKVGHVIVISTSRALLKRYQDHFKVGNSIPVWVKNNQGYWRQSNQTITVPEGTLNNVSWQLIKG